MNQKTLPQPKTGSEEPVFASPLKEGAKGVCISFRRKQYIVPRQSLRQNRFRRADFASSLYTREPWALPRQLLTFRYYKLLPLGWKPLSVGEGHRPSRCSIP